MQRRPGRGLERDRRVRTRRRHGARRRCGDRRQRRRRRHGGRNSCARGTQGRRAGRGPAEDVQRLPDARVRGVPGPVPGIGGAQDARQGDQHSPGPLRRRRHDGQLDEFVPHAAVHAGVLAARIRTRRVRRRRPGAVVRANGGAAVDRSLGSRAQRKQRGAGARRQAHRHLRVVDPPQRRRLLEPGLLRHGLSGQCQAVDAGHDHSRRAGEGRHARDARARAQLRAGRRSRDAARRTRNGRAGHRADAAQRARAGEGLHCRGRRHRHAGAADCAAARPIPTASSASARSCILRWSRPR